ncbi:MAG: thioredoxin family protein [Turneriella sp.]|nr:thioredoxin family protein [Turneriella sp.]
MRIKIGVCIFLAAAALGAEGVPVKGGLHSKVTLHLENSTVKPGSTVYAALEFALDKDWHIYYKNPGDSGIAPTVKINTAEVIPGEILFPPPEKIVAASLTSYGYHGRTVLLVPLNIATASKPGKLKVEGKLEYLECRESCLPAGGDFSFDMPVGETTQNDAGAAAVFNAAREKLPRPSPFEIRKISENSFSIQLPISAAEIAAIPDPLGAVDVPTPQATIEKNLVRLEYPAGKKRSEGLLLSLRDKDQWSHYTVALPTASAETPVLLYFLFAVLGGLILNFMPCVLPVLSLKAMSLVSEKPLPASGTPPLAKGRGRAWGYTLGVIATFSAIGGLFLILRASGQAIGWGFQLQNPIFVAAIAILFAVMAINLFGVFEIRVPAITTRPAIGEAMTGVIAVVAATPCTAPFMASALGAALTLPAAAGFLMFPLLGLGMALPFSVLAVFPRAGKILPKPGNWLITFKGVLGFMMAGSALWLVWVFGSLTNAAFSLLTAILLIAFALYIYGKHQVTPAGRPVKIARYAAMVVALVFAFRFAFVGLTPAAKTNTEAGVWKNFSPAAVQAEIAAKNPVFVDFTADWCLSCKVNEQVAFTDKVMQRFAERRVILFKADFTNLDETIANEITRLGRAGVPVYAFYDKNGNLTLLPQVLTEGLMLEQIQNLTN